MPEVVDLRPSFFCFDDLTPYLADDGQLDWPKLFGNANPVELDVGCGRGMFLFNASTTQPERNFLGVELDFKEGRRGAKRLFKRQQPNARVVGGDANYLLDHLIRPASLAAVHVYFPDPWWKKRHRKRRVMTEAFARDIERTLAAGGTLHFWTDVEEYFQETLALLAAETKLVGPLSVAERPADDDLDYRTHFERRMRMHDLPVYRAEFRRASILPMSSSSFPKPSSFSP